MKSVHACILTILGFGIGSSAVLAAGPGDDEKPVYNRSIFDGTSGVGGNATPNRTQLSVDVIVPFGAKTVRDFYLNPDDRSHFYSSLRFSGVIGNSVPEAGNQDYQNSTENLLMRTLYASALIRMNDHWWAGAGAGIDTVNVRDEYTKNLVEGKYERILSLPSFAAHAGTVGSTPQATLSMNEKVRNGEVGSVSVTVFENRTPGVWPELASDTSGYTDGSSGTGGMLRLNGRTLSQGVRGRFQGEYDVVTSGNLCIATTPGGNYVQGNVSICETDYSDEFSFFRNTNLVHALDNDIYVGTGEERKGFAWSGRYTCSVGRYSVGLGADYTQDLVANYQNPGTPIDGLSLTAGAGCRVLESKGKWKRGQESGASYSVDLTAQCRQPIADTGNDDTEAQGQFLVRIRCML